MIYLEIGADYSYTPRYTTEEAEQVLRYISYSQEKGTRNVRGVPINAIGDSDYYGQKTLRENLFIGTTEFMKKVFSCLGLPKEKWILPRNNDLPYETKTLAEARKLKNIFIKPVETKLFTGFVLDGCNYPHLNEVTQDSLVYVYEAVDQTKIASEWRGYVYKKELDDIKNYSGSPFVFPDIDFIKGIVEKNKKDFPSTYTIDVAVMDDGRNWVVEYNDMWAIGNYGVRVDIYLKYLTERYFEIVKS